MLNDGAALRRMTQAAGKVLGEEQVQGLIHQARRTRISVGTRIRSLVPLDSSAAGIRIGESCMRYTSPDSIQMRMSWCMGCEYGYA